MQKEKVYVIERNGLLLNKLFEDNVEKMFNVKGRGQYCNEFDVSEVYFYHNMRIAADVAYQLDALWIPAIKNGLKLETL